MRTIPNTPTNIYFDSEAVKQHCDKDFKAIARACKPQSERNNKKKTKGLAGTFSKMTEKLDDIGQRASGYSRNRNNAWMDDHCSGLWVKPKVDATKYSAEELAGLRESINNLDIDIFKELGMLMDGLDDMFELAKEIIPGSAYKRISAWYIARLAAKGIIGGIGAAPSGGTVTAAMAALQIADTLYTAAQLASYMGDKGLQALRALEQISSLGDKAKELLADMVSNPAKAHTNLMSLLAFMDSCLRARKCLLVPYSQQNSNSGQGCCPGQTGHHIIPHSAAEGKCSNYSKDTAPVMCLEGTNNNEGWGTHGNAHAKLRDIMRDYRKSRTDSGLSPNTISYDDMANKAVDAVRLSGAALQCDKNCLLAQLKAYYNCPDDMLPKDGTGPMSKMPEPTEPSGNDNHR